MEEIISGSGKTLVIINQLKSAAQLKIIVDEGVID